MRKISNLAAVVFLSEALSGCEEEAPKPVYTKPTSYDEYHAKELAELEAKQLKSDQAVEAAKIERDRLEQERTDTLHSNGPSYEKDFVDAVKIVRRAIDKVKKDIPLAEVRAVDLFKKRVKKAQLPLDEREALFSELTAGTGHPKFTYQINGKTVNVVGNYSNGNCGSSSVKELACTPDSDILDCAPEECDDGGDSIHSGFTVEVKGETTYVFELGEGYEGRSASISFAIAGGSAPMEMELISLMEPHIYNGNDGETVRVPYSFNYENSYRPELSSTSTDDQNSPEWPSRLNPVWNLKF